MPASGRATANGLRVASPWMGFPAHDSFTKNAISTAATTATGRFDFFIAHLPGRAGPRSSRTSSDRVVRLLRVDGQLGDRRAEVAVERARLQRIDAHPGVVL